MPLLPPHLIDTEATLEEDFSTKGKGKIGRQGPSKYGKGGSRVHKAKGRPQKK